MIADGSTHAGVHTALAASRPIRARLAWTVSVFGLLAAATCVLAPLVGSTPISLRRALDPSLPFASNVDAQILFIARLPRVLAGALVGASLASSGVVFQALLRNPLASPDTLGISAGDSLQISASDQGLLLQPVREKASLIKELGVWVYHPGQPFEGSVTDLIDAARDERSRRLIAKWRTIECRLLRLRDRGEVDYPACERNLGSCPEDRRRSFGKDRILLELHRYLSWSGKKCVRPREGYAAEIVIHCVIGSADQRNSIDEKPLGVGPHLNRAEHQASRFAVSLRLVTRADVIDRNRPLSGFHVFRRRRVDRVVRRIPWPDETISREWP